VHGVENKASKCFVFVRGFIQDGKPVIEIEDTGAGMPEELAVELEKRMNSVNMEMLKEGRSIGILNACLRLKLSISQDVRFTITSEPEVGTTVTIYLDFKEKF
jgi:two-component system sensor histidine kinase YesM